MLKNNKKLQYDICHVLFVIILSHIYWLFHNRYIVFQILSFEHLLLMLCYLVA